MSKASVFAPALAKRLKKLADDRDGGARKTAGFTGTPGSRTRVGPVVDVRIDADGGTAGDESTAATLTYSIYPFGDELMAGTPLATEVPLEGRGQRVVTAFVFPGTIGRAYKSSGDWKLIWANETFDQQNCVPPE